MKRIKSNYIKILVLILSMISFTVVSQNEEDIELLGLPGDNLDLYAVLDLFQQSPSIEEFEKLLNDEDKGINNIDLDLDEKVDFIKVVTKQDGESFTFILQVDVSETETQDVAVILLNKNDEGKVTLQMVGDETLYGKDYVVEPLTEPTPAVTANPAYTGDNPVVSVEASTTVVVVETVPVVQYVYSPVYVPYYPPYYYAYYPPYYRPWVVVSVGVYRHHHYHCHRHYRGGHYHRGGNTVVIHNHNNYNNYKQTRSSSTTVSRNNSNGRYDTRSGTSTRQSTNKSTSTRQSSTSRPSTGASTTPSSRPSTTSPSSRPSTTPNTRPTTTTPNSRPSSSTPSTRPSTTMPSTRQSTAPRQSVPSSGSPRQSGGGRTR